MAIINLKDDNGNGDNNDDDDEKSTSLPVMSTMLWPSSAGGIANCGHDRKRG